jgi:predicted phage terminase large subunit-like protein
MSNLLSSALDAAARELEHQYATEEELAERRAEIQAGGLRRFVGHAWLWLEPGTPFVPNWHIDAICEHLELAFAGEITRLLINIQPRVMKTLLVGVCAPVWRWTTNPETRFLTASFSRERALDPAVKSRALIATPWFQQAFGDVFRLTGDQNEKSRYMNNRTGHRIATSVGSSVTGEGGDILILDDPNSGDDAHSAAARERAKNWWGGVWSTRLNDQRTGVKIVIQQRVHEEDISGLILDSEGRLEDGGRWVHLCLPAEYEASHPFVCPREIELPSGRKAPGDPRTAEGELLWPEKLPLDALASLRDEMHGSAAGQLQQRPAPAEGAILKRHWWRYYEPEQWPAVTGTVSYWDTTWKAKTTSDFVVGVIVGITGANRYVLRRYRGRWPLVEAAEQIKASREWLEERMPRLGHTIYVEATANGPEIVAALRDTVPGVTTARVERDKVARAFAVTPSLEAGQVFLPGRANADGTGPDPSSPAWVLELVDECASFPNGAYDDQVDAITGALIRAGHTGPGRAPAIDDQRRPGGRGVTTRLGYGSRL